MNIKIKFPPNLLPNTLHFLLYPPYHNIQNSSSTYTIFTPYQKYQSLVVQPPHTTQPPPIRQRQRPFSPLPRYILFHFFFHHATMFHGSGIISSPVGIFTLVHTLLFQLWFECSICRWPSPRNERSGIS